MEDELSRPGYRQYTKKRADGSVWRVEEHAHNVFSLSMQKYYEAWKIADDRGLPPPEPPPPELREGDEKVVCIERTKTRLGVRWKEADGRVFESDESGMVYAVDSRGERIVDPKFRRHRRPTNESADEQ